MDFERSEQQVLLADTLARFARDNESAGFETVWPFLIESGFLALLLSEPCGGLGGGADDLVVTAETLGEWRLAAPYAEAVSALHALASAGDQESVDATLGGDSLWLTAWQDLPSKPIRQANGRVSGMRLLVPFGAHADGFVVPLRDDALVVAVSAADVGVSERLGVDGRPAANVGIDTETYRVLAEGDDARRLFGELEAMALRAQCGELVGIMRALLQRTIHYVNDRRQFGRAIGGFQVVRHRLADLYVALEQCAGLLLLATFGNRTALSAAKYALATAAIDIGHEAIQLHGGMGTTTELDIAHYHTRLRMLAGMLGAPDEHLSDFASAGDRRRDALTLAGEAR